MKELIEEYRELLKAEESVPGLVRSIALIERILGVDVVWEPGRLGYRRRSNEWSGFLTAADDYDLPELKNVASRHRRTVKNSEKQALIVKTAYHLAVVPEIVERADREMPAARHSLYLDTCLLLFHHAFFALMPELRDRGWELERQALSVSFQRFAQYLPRISDRYSVLALCYEAAEDPERAAQYYREALRATHTDAHEFMTTLQTYWSFLVQHQMLQQAFELLLETYPRVPRQDLDEMADLMASTFQLQRRYYEARIRTAGASRATLRPRTSEA